MEISFLRERSYFKDMEKIRTCRLGLGKVLWESHFLNDSLISLLSRWRKWHGKGAKTQPAPLTPSLGERLGTSCC